MLHNFMFLWLCSSNSSSSIQPLGQFGQEPEPSQVTGMALVRCILGKFSGVVCHCFPPRLYIPTFAARCLHIHNDARDPSSERWNYGQERFSGNFAYTPLGIFYMPQIYDILLKLEPNFVDIMCYWFIIYVYCDVWNCHLVTECEENRKLSPNVEPGRSVSAGKSVHANVNFPFIDMNH